MEIDDNDIIDRDEFFGPPDDTEGEEDDDDDDDDMSEDDDEDEEDLSDEEMDDMAGTDETFDMYIDRLYKERLAPIVWKISGDREKASPFQALLHCPEFGKIEYLHLGANELLPMMYRPEARQEFISAIHTRGKLTLAKVYLSFIIPGGQEQWEPVPTHLRNECLLELGRAFSVCNKIQIVDFMIHVDSADMDEAYSYMVSLLPQVRQFNVAVQHTDEEYVPRHLLQSLGNAPSFESLELGESNPLTVQCCLQNLARAASLKRFEWQNSFLDFQNRPPVSADEATELARLLRADKLETLELVCLNLSEPSTARIICEAIVSSIQLKVLQMRSLVLGPAMNDFYTFLGQNLPSMKKLEQIVFFLGFEKSESARLGPEREVDQACQLAILQGAAFAPKLEDVVLPNCYWTASLVNGLNQCLATSRSIRKLDFRGCILHGRPTALSNLKAGLEHCQLESLRCIFADESDILAVAVGVSMNRSIQTLSVSCQSLSFDTITQVCHILRHNHTLKKLTCISDRFARQSVLTIEELNVEEYPEAFQRFVNALAANVGLEAVELRPGRIFGDDERLAKVISIFTRLNKQGRPYITRSDDPNFLLKACRFLGSINDSLDCLFVHLHDIPQLFQRR